MIRTGPAYDDDRVEGAEWGHLRTNINMNLRMMKDMRDDSSMDVTWGPGILVLRKYGQNSKVACLVGSM